MVSKSIWVPNKNCIFDFLISEETKHSKIQKISRAKGKGLQNGETSNYSIKGFEEIPYPSGSSYSVKLACLKPSFYKYRFPYGDNLTSVPSYSRSFFSVESVVKHSVNYGKSSFAELLDSIIANLNRRNLTAKEYFKIKKSLSAGLELASPNLSNRFKKLVLRLSSGVKKQVFERGTSCMFNIIPPKLFYTYPQNDEEVMSSRLCFS